MSERPIAPVEDEIGQRIAAVVNSQFPASLVVMVMDEGSVFGFMFGQVFLIPALVTIAPRGLAAWLIELRTQEGSTPIMLALSVNDRQFQAMVEYSKEKIVYLNRVASLIQEVSSFGFVICFSSAKDKPEVIFRGVGRDFAYVRERLEGSINLIEERLFDAMRCSLDREALGSSLWEAISLRLTEMGMEDLLKEGE